MDLTETYKQMVHDALFATVLNDSNARLRRIAEDIIIALLSGTPPTDDTTLRIDYNRLQDWLNTDWQ